MTTTTPGIDLDSAALDKLEVLTNKRIIEICDKEGLGPCLGLAVGRAIEREVLARRASASQISKDAAPVPFRLGNEYQTQAGDWVRFETVHNEGTSYETMADQHGHHRYTRRDFGRVTGTAHDYSYPGNTPPLYAAPMSAGAAAKTEQDRLSKQSVELLRKGLRDWETPENRYAAQRVLDTIEASAAGAGSEQDAMAAEMDRLHNALCFWLPQNHAGLPDVMQQRIAADAYLLVGYDDMPDKQSAEELGWIAALAKQSGAHAAADDAKDAARYRWLRDALDSGQITSGLHEAFQQGGAALDVAIDANRADSVAPAAVEYDHSEGGHHD